MRRLSFLTVAMLVLLGATAEARESLLYAHCPNESSELIGTIEGRVLLHRAFLDTGADEAAAIRASIEQQLKYVWGFQHNEPALQKARQVVLSSEAPEIAILGRHETTYGRALALPYDVDPNDAQLKVDDAYTKRALARGFTKVSDPALSVEYRARIKLAICGRSAATGKSLQAPLPPDPWLAYWYVEKKNHRLLDYFGTKLVTNPCADDDFATLPHPIYYWYDWLPTRRGLDASKNHFDCATWLKVGRDYDHRTLALERVGVPSASFSSLRRDLLQAGKTGPLRATFVLGILDHHVTQPVLESNERGAKMLWTTLADLAGFFDEEKREVRIVEGGYQLVELSGKLKQSGQGIRLRFLYGLTDILGPVPPTHWTHLRRALAEDHVVVYWGHSGVGENFRLAQIEKNVGADHETLAAELARSPLRLVAYLSCFSYMYFGRDLLAAATTRATPLAFVFTGMGGTRKDDGPSAVLAMIDDILATPNETGRLTHLSGVGADEYWIIKEIEGKSAP